MNSRHFRACAISGSSFDLGDQVDLVEDENDRRLRFLEQAGDELVAVPRARRRVEHQHDNVDFTQRIDGGVHHPDVQPMEGPMDARRIDEHDLAVRIVLHAEDAARVVCGLSETIATFAPISVLSRVDLPALGRPIRET